MEGEGIKGVCNIQEIMKKVMCFGTFDKLHPGHLSYLKQAKEFGDYLIVVVGRDKRVEKLKGKTPSENEEERRKNLNNANIADEVILGSLENRYKVIQDKKPDVICLGYDQKADLGKLKEIFKGKIIRLKPYKQDIYKSSRIKICPLPSRGS